MNVITSIIRYVFYFAPVTIFLVLFSGKTSAAVPKPMIIDSLKFAGVHLSEFPVHFPGKDTVVQSEVKMNGVLLDIKYCKVMLRISQSLVVHFQIDTYDLFNTNLLKRYSFKYFGSPEQSTMGKKSAFFLWELKMNNVLAKAVLITVKNGRKAELATYIAK